mmetsp:Transcript_18996/g.34294  ORF Transcript_18996/g.34294 Transcript_18996/m.34294 type:complete len:141 (-) Transcript_18996:190-612(-)
MATGGKSKNLNGSDFLALEVEEAGSNRVRLKGVVQDTVPSWRQLQAESPATARRRIVHRQGNHLSYLIAACMLAAACLWLWSSVMAVHRMTPRLRGSIAAHLRHPAPRRRAAVAAVAADAEDVPDSASPLTADPTPLDLK